MEIIKFLMEDCFCQNDAKMTSSHDCETIKCQLHLKLDTGMFKWFVNQSKPSEELGLNYYFVTVVAAGGITDVTIHLC